MLIIHGEDIVSARNQLNDLIEQARSRGQAVRRLTAKELDLTGATQIFEATTLFGETPLIVIEGLFSQVKSKTKDRLIGFVAGYQDRDILLYEDKALTPSILKLFAEAEIKEHKPAAIIFTFLDYLKPGGAAKSLSLLADLEIARQPAELIFAMLVRQVRLLIQALDPDRLHLLPWKKNRLAAQARAFGEVRLLKLHRDLYRIDKDIKTGVNPLDLSLQLTSLIANL